MSEHNLGEAEHVKVARVGLGTEEVLEQDLVVFEVRSPGEQLGEAEDVGDAEDDSSSGSEQAAPLLQRSQDLRSRQMLEDVLGDQLLVVPGWEQVEIPDIGHQVGAVEILKIDVEVALAMVKSTAKIDAPRMAGVIETLRL
jgi:hypothetical protein